MLFRSYFPIVFSPDGGLALSKSADGCSIRLWDLKAGDCTKTFECLTEDFASVVFSSDGNKILSGGYDGVLRLWDISTGESRQLYKSDSNINSVALSKDGSQALICSNAILSLLGTASDACIQKLDENPNWFDVPTQFCFTPDGEAVSAELSLKVWNLTNGNCIQTMHGHTFSLNNLMYLPNSQKILCGGNDFYLRLWDLSSGICSNIGFGEIVDSGGSIKAFSKDGRFTCYVEIWNPTIFLIDTTTGEHIRSFEGHSKWINSIAFSTDGNKLLSSSGDDSLRLWDVMTGDCIWTQQLPRFSIKSISFSPDGSMALLGGQVGVYAENKTNLRVYEMVSGTCIYEFKGHSKDVYATCFSHDGDYAISGSYDGTIRLWDWDNGIASCFHVLEGHKGSVNTVIFNSNSRMAISGSSDCTLRLWDLKKGECLRIFEGHSSGISCVKISPDMRNVISGDYDGSLIIWNMETGEKQIECYGFDDGTWAVVTPDGRYDSSNNGDCPHLRWTVGMESYSVTKFKERYYTPGLLRQVRDVKDIKDGVKNLAPDL